MAAGAKDDLMAEDTQGDPLIQASGERNFLCVVDELVALSHMAGDEAVLSTLMESGERLDLTRCEFRAELALCLAAGRGDIAAVERLLRSGAEVNCAPSFGGMTPMMFAARSGHLGVLEMLLLQPGISLHATTSGGQTALSLCRDVATRRLAAHAVAERSGDGGRSALVQAACLGHVTVLRALLDAGVDPDHRDEKGRTVLLIGALRHHLEVCELLLSRGADPHKADISGRDVWAAADERLRIALQFYATTA